MITKERLRELLHYNPRTGIFKWRFSSRLSKLRKRGAIAGKVGNDKYRRIWIDKQTYQANRLAWLYVYGQWPVKLLDHINNDRDDNRITNLREATDKESAQNRKVRSDNKTGFKGVHWHKERKVYIARITVKGRQIFLGRFDDPEQAHFAYCRAAFKYYGDFARFK
jgi:hypothetical protein